MKVAVVCPYDIGLPGGVQGQAVALVEWLQVAGHEAWLVAPGHGGPPGTIEVGATRRVPANRSQAPVALDPRVAKRVVAAVADADAVHIHEPFMPMVSTAALVKSDRPLVGTFHADPGRGVMALYALARPLWRNWARRLSVATAVSAVARAAVAPFVDARIVPNAIDTAAYAGSKAKRHGSVAFLGRDEPRKGLDVLLAAWPEIRRRVPDATLVVGGAQRSEAPPGVTFRAELSEPDKVEMLATAEVFVAPNTGGESFGLVLAEGMASGCAVVATALPAFAAVVGDAGNLIPPRDPQALAEAVVSLLVDPAARAALAVAAKARALQFDRDVVFPQHVDAYRVATG